MCRDALLHRSHEIQPAFFDSENFFFRFFLYEGWTLGVARALLAERWVVRNGAVACVTYVWVCGAEQKSICATTCLLYTSDAADE